MERGKKGGGLLVRRHVAVSREEELGTEAAVGAELVRQVLHVLLIEGLLQLTGHLGAQRAVAVVVEPAQLVDACRPAT